MQLLCHSGPTVLHFKRQEWLSMVTFSSMFKTFFEVKKSDAYVNLSDKFLTVFTTDCIILLQWRRGSSTVWQYSLSPAVSRCCHSETECSKDDLTLPTSKVILSYNALYRSSYLLPSSESCILLLYVAVLSCPALSLKTVEVICNSPIWLPVWFFFQVSVTALI